MNQCYVFHDMMLGRMMELAGPETTTIILSDHGFHSGDLRPAGTSAIRDGQPVAWHRTYGVIAVNGPDIRRDERLYGASLLDITPTILMLMGLPVASDMDGKPLTQILIEPCAVAAIPTYEDEPATDRESPAADQPSADVAEDPWAARQIIEQFKALGYIDTDDTETIALDRERNLGQVYLATGRPAKALVAYGRALAMKDDDIAALMGQASAHMRLGNLEACETIIAGVAGDKLDEGRRRMFLGMIAFRRKDDDKALEHLLAAEQADEGLSGLNVMLGQIYLRNDRLDDAERALSTALEHDPDDAEAHDYLGMICYRRGQAARALHHHMESIGRLHHRPQTHINLGLATAQLGRIRWAIRAFETALEMAPDHPVAHQALAQLYKSTGRFPEKAEHHDTRAREILAKRRGAGP